MRGAWAPIGHGKEERKGTHAYLRAHCVQKLEDGNTQEISLTALSDAPSPHRHGEDMIVTPFAQVSVHSSPLPAGTKQAESTPPFPMWTVPLPTGPGQSSDSSEKCCSASPPARPQGSQVHGVGGGVELGLAERMTGQGWEEGQGPADRWVGWGRGHMGEASHP